MVKALSMMSGVLFFFALGLFLLPFIFWPLASVVFEVPRVWFLLIWIELLGVLSVLHFLKHKPLKLKWSGVLMLGVFFLLAVISSLLAGNFSHSFYGNYYRFDGLITLAHLLIFSVWVAVFFDKKWLRFFLWPIGCSVLILSVISIFQGLMHLPRPASLSFGQPNFLAGYLLVGLPAVLSCVKQFPKRFEKTSSVLSFILIALAMAFTQSVGGILGLGLFVVLVLFSKNQLRMNWIFPSVIIFLLIFFSLAYAAFKDSTVAESRERIVRKLVPAIATRPVFGWGWANVDQAFQSTIWPIKYEHDIHVDKAHSLILESFVTTGVIGGSIYCLLLIYIGKALLTEARRFTDFSMEVVLLFMFALFVYHSQTNVISISEEIIFWFLVGMGLQKSRVGVELKEILR